MQSATARNTPIEFIRSPFVRFARMEAAGGIVLLASTLIALFWANSPWEHSYHQLLETQFSVGFGKLVVSENRHHWINDGLMSLFFFLVGLEIKRELLVGELSSIKRAAFPFIAALGGMIVPAAIYLALTHGGGAEHGWAIPISTDIAFALGVLAFLGSRIPITLKIFVTALAIVDDIFAVIVIAIFYTGNLNYLALGMGLLCVTLSLVANLLGIRKPVVYAIIGILAWFGVLNSGVHATIAGILLAFTIPAHTFMDKSEFLEKSRSLLDQLEVSEPHSSQEQAIIDTLEQNVTMVESPLHRIEHRLQPWIGFLIMPLFALANAGVKVPGNIKATLINPVTWGVALGLVIGKPVGIWVFGMAATKFGLAAPLNDVSSRQILGAASLCGIGFTMSLFVGTLAFGEGELLQVSKLAILAASVTSAVLGAMLLRPASRPS